eukprot:scaffold32257_cov56-Phaeocystis_antarctica.AAC.10
MLATVDMFNDVALPRTNAADRFHLRRVPPCSCFAALLMLDQSIECIEYGRVVVGHMATMHNRASDP